MRGSGAKIGDWPALLPAPRRLAASESRTSSVVPPASHLFRIDPAEADKRRHPAEEKGVKPQTQLSSFANSAAHQHQCVVVKRTRPWLSMGINLGRKRGRYGCHLAL